MGIIKLNNRGVRSATDIGGTTSLGSWVFIKKLTASSDSTISFVDGTSDVVLDDTYKEYVFTFNNIHPENEGDGVKFSFNFSVDTGSNYNVAKTTSVFRAYHNESDASGLGYRTGSDLAQGTGFQELGDDINAGDGDECTSGYLHLFDPSSTTFVKHFIASNNIHSTGQTKNFYTAGYGNTTSAVDAVQFKMSADNIDAGDICLYGIS